MLSKVTSFDLVPESGKLVVLDVGLTVQTAFQALRENGTDRFLVVLCDFLADGSHMRRYQIRSSVGIGRASIHRNDFRV